MGCQLERSKLSQPCYLRRNRCWVLCSYRKEFHCTKSICCVSRHFTHGQEYRTRGTGMWSFGQCWRLGRSTVDLVLIIGFQWHHVDQVCRSYSFGFHTFKDLRDLLFPHLVGPGNLCCVAWSRLLPCFIVQLGR